MTEMTETVANKLQEVLDTKENLKDTIYKISSDADINSAPFNSFTTYLKSLPFLYDSDKIQGDIVAVYNKDDTEFNYDNTENIRYFPVGGDSDLNNSNRVIAYSGLDLDNLNSNVLNFESLLRYSNIHSSITLNYSEAFGSSVQFSTIAKKLTLNIDPNKTLATPNWEVGNCSNLEYLNVGELYFPRASESIGNKILFQNLPKLTYLSFSGAADTLPKLSTLYADCPKLETVRVKIKPTQYTNIEEITDTLIVNQSLDEVHLIIDSADTTGTCYLQGLTTPSSYRVINRLILESVNTENSVTELMLYTNDGYYGPHSSSNVRSLKIVKDFDCCLLLGNLQLPVINQLPKMLENLKYNDGDKEDRHLQIHPMAESYYSSEIIQAIKSVLEEKNWTYVEN